MRRSRTQLAMVVLVLLVPAGMVRGDAAPSFLKPDTNLPALRFDNLAEYPDFDFYLLYFSGRGAPGPLLVRIESSEAPRNFENGRRGLGAYLLAVPHGARPPSIHWSGSDTPPGCLRSTPLGGIDYGPGYLVPYRVKIADDNLEVAMQPIEWQPGVWSLKMLKAWPCVLVPIVFCVVLGWLGARVARRLFPAKPARATDVP